VPNLGGIGIGWIAHLRNTRRTKRRPSRAYRSSDRPDCSYAPAEPIRIARIEGSDACYQGLLLG